MPQPLSWTWSRRTPPSLTLTLIELAPASSAFSSSSLSAFAGRWMISPAAILLTTSCGSLSIRPTSIVHTSAHRSWPARRRVEHASSQATGALRQGRLIAGTATRSKNGIADRECSSIGKDVGTLKTVRQSSYAARSVALGRVLGPDRELLLGYEPEARCRKARQ